MNFTPKISFVVPSYNHEKYVGQFIESVLSQTEQNFELILIDDCSSDRNVEEIQKFTDSRIHLIQHDYNRGINYGFSEGCQLAKGEIISWIASDDLLEPNYVEKVLKEFENSQIGAVYVTLAILNENNQKLSTDTFQLPHGKTEEEIFVKSFLDYNQLPSPGMAFRKSVILPFLPLDNGLFHYADSQIHFFLLYHTKISMLKEKLVKYCVLDTSASRNSDLALREEIETQKLMDTVLELFIDDVDKFSQFFEGHEALQDVVIEAKAIPFLLGKIALKSPLKNKRRWGYQMLMNSISNSDDMDFLSQTYGFTFKEYLKLVPQEPSLNKKIEKYKKRAQMFSWISAIMMVFILWLIYTN